MEAKEKQLFDALKSPELPPSVRSVITPSPSQHGWDAVDWKELFTSCSNEPDLAFQKIPYNAEYRHLYALRCWLQNGNYQDLYTKHEAQIRASFPLPIPLAKVLAATDATGKSAPGQK